MIDLYHIFIVSIVTTQLKYGLVVSQSIKQHTNIYQLVTTMTKQNTLNRKMVELTVQLLSTQYGPNFCEIKSIIKDKLTGQQINRDELRGLIYESFLSVWNLTAEEFDMLRDDLTAMLLHCKGTNPELFAEFEVNTFSKVKFDSTRCKYNYPCVRLVVDGDIYRLVGGTSLHLHLFYGEVMFDRFGPYKGEIELTHGEFEAIRTKTLFFPPVYIK